MKWQEVFTTEIFVVAYEPDKHSLRDVFFGEIFLSLKTDLTIKEADL